MSYLIENNEGCIKLVRRRIEPVSFREIFFTKGKAIRRDLNGGGVEYGPAIASLGVPILLNPGGLGAFGRVFIMEISGMNSSAPYVWSTLINQSGTGATYHWTHQGSAGIPSMTHLISMYLSHSTTSVTITLLEGAVGASAQIKAWYGAGELIYPMNFLEQELP